MNDLEEQLWHYIDGTCTPSEKVEVEIKLAADEAFASLYQELLMVHQQLLTAIEVDEPSMSFTRNVMDQVAMEVAPVKLKTKIDHKIIYAIGGFFIVSLLCLLGYAAASPNPNSEVSNSAINLSFNFSGLFNSTALIAFVFLDLVLLLIYFDAYLRRGLKSLR